ncbi:MAG: prenyltransferase/squalene oxidase repeat-containing protein [Patescibacteria group bacterium]
MNIIKNIKAGVEFLNQQQRADGSFDSWSSPVIDNFSGAKKYRTVFANGLILHGLNICQIDGLDKLKTKLFNFLRRQKGENWRYNYWVINSREYKRYRVPDDLDDTFVVLAALYGHDSEYLRPKDFAAITNVLTSQEEMEGGPYRTWWVPDDFDAKWRDVDVVVNANIAYFLHLNAIHLPNLDSYLDKMILQDKLQSRYYPDEYSTIYYLSRFYQGRYKNRLVDWLGKRKNEVMTANILNLALYVLATINLGMENNQLEKMVDKILAEQKNGGWPAAGFCLDPMLGREKYYSGCQSLSTVYCLAALAKYADKFLIKVKKNQPVKSVVVAKHQVVYDNIVNLARTDFGKLAGDLRADSLNFLDKMVKKDEDGEIVLLPWVVALSLSTVIDKKMVQKFCQASLYGWMAYTLYDNFLDGEGEPWMLPVANVCWQRLNKIYADMGNPKMVDRMEKLLRIMEEANSWEVNNARLSDKRRVDSKNLPDFVDYKMIAEKSIGHALGAINVIELAGGTSRDKQNMYDFFINYLIARQLNDDAHDWEVDLRRGQINAVGEMALGDFFRQTRRRYFVYVRDIDKLRLIFWQGTIHKVTKIILHKTKKARRLIGRVKVVGDTNFYFKRLDKLDGAARLAISEASAVEEFVDSYK